jgi:hypothetical protein
MQVSQPPANPGNTLIITGNEQARSSSPLVGSLFLSYRPVHRLLVGEGGSDLPPASTYLARPRAPSGRAALLGLEGFHGLCKAARRVRRFHSLSTEHGG